MERWCASSGDATRRASTSVSAWRMKSSSRSRSCSRASWACDRRLPLADPGLNRFLDEEALRRLNARPREDDALEAVRRCISRRLASRGVALDDVAQDLGLSPGEVRRRLRAGGTTFRALVDEVRRARAEALLVAGGLSLSEVALLLGFSELSAFSRAHRRWFSSSARARRVKS